MKRKLLNYIVCYSCQGLFDVYVDHEEDGEIIGGKLICSQCAQKFPIIDGVPRILPSDLEKIKQKTQESFGYEWTHFSEMYKEWEKNFKHYFEPAGIQSIYNKLVLEIGCGKGRHTFYAAKYAREVIAIDFSQAISVAYQNNKHLNNVHFIQADIYNLPIRSEIFDFVFCLGVLHHLPTPMEGFKKILNPLKKDGGILIYLYHNFPKYSLRNMMIRLINIIRFFTTRIPHNFLHIICYPVAFVLYFFVIVPYKLLKIKKETLPLILYRGYPFRIFLNDTFDRFSAPIENRYSRDEAASFYRKNDCKLVKILSNGGWRIFGYKL